MQANVYITLHRYLSKCCIDAAYSPKQGSCGNSARNLPSMNTITITYMFINSGVQTFREPFAALSRSFATAAKTYIHMCKCHSDTKSLAWVLERLPYINIYTLLQTYIDMESPVFVDNFRTEKTPWGFPQQQLILSWPVENVRCWNQMKWPMKEHKFYGRLKWGKIGFFSGKHANISGKRMTEIPQLQHDSGPLVFWGFQNEIKWIGPIPN